MSFESLILADSPITDDHIKPFNVSIELKHLFFRLAFTDNFGKVKHP